MRQRLALAWGLFFATASGEAHAEVRFDLHLYMQPNYYAAYPDPFIFANDPEFEFVTGRMSSADGRFSMHSDYQGWTFDAPTIFTSVTELLSAVDQQWILQFDEGLATERTYTTTVNVSGLQESDLLPPVILSPGVGSITSSLLPTFEFTHPTSHSYQLRLLAASSNGSSYEVANLILPSDATMWTPDAPLLPDTRYILSISSYPSTTYFPDLGFDAPVDATGNPLPGWESSVTTLLESNTYFFTPVPEPSSLTLLMVGGSVLFLLRRRNQSARPGPPCIPSLLHTENQIVNS